MALFFDFIGNSDFWRHKNKHMFIKQEYITFLHNDLKIFPGEYSYFHYERKRREKQYPLMNEGAGGADVPQALFYAYREVMY